MTQESISKHCLAGREQLISKYCGSLPLDHAISLKEIGKLAEQLESDYKHYLSELWERLKGSDERSFEQILDKRYNRYFLNRVYAKDIRVSQSAAEEITIWEQITNSNYRDIEHLNALIVAYARDLLAQITGDFLEEI